ncbi:MAG: Stp1/IreP family PP2C-type Ser/Thr phosphatase [Clostridia bacterium]|nr:Stp1/IreP family PP2C-type Ser/Thr phosphatase [Clostridia bacterium]MBQ9919974.1 Stp1/IreP family PP2C-type Ser/Thr phosphatase [Clostridia bacterium]
MLVSAKTDIGMKRSTNQDSYSYGQFENGTITWAVVCDGMGGMAAGNIASITAVEVIAGALEQNLSPKSSPSFVKNLLKTSIESANAKIFSMAEENEDMRGMGTTVVAVVVIKGVAYFAHAGDSRAYYYSNNQLSQVTTDHSVVQTLLESGQLTQDEAKNHPNKNIITRALGVASYIDVDFETLDVSEGDTVLLCTDGLTNCIDDELIKLASTDNDFSSLAERLVELANQNGGNDNITVVAVKI